MINDGIKHIWVFINSDEKGLNKSALDLLVKAGSLIEPYSDFSLNAVIIAPKNANEKIEQLKSYGVDRILYAENEQMQNGNHLLCGDYLSQLVTQFTPHILLFASSDDASQIAATVGGKAKLGIMAHCMDLKLDKDGLLTGLIPAYGGSGVGEIYCADCRPQIATARLSPPKCDYKPASEIKIEKLPDYKENKAKLPTLQEETLVLNQGSNIEDAQLILCGGAGMENKENWDMLTEISTNLGGAVACTRPPIDKGWAGGEYMMIGTSGKYVKPKVYIGLGVSGTSHHICGMQDSDTIFAINNDPSAAIFELADYGFVADSGEFLNEYRKLLKEKRAEKYIAAND